ncbi:MAG TPA: hypothetical protein VE987_02365 [Polyangiaceae bacterium]|nr:hypothetical protein [Polyangiaceae bacterium]
MTTPQDPGRRRKQKARRSKQLAAWRALHPAKPAAPSTAPRAGEKPAR